MTTAINIEVYKTRAKKDPWTWRMRSTHNGKIIANAAETFDSPGNARRAARRMGAYTGAAVFYFEDDRNPEVIQAAAPEAPPAPPPQPPVLIAGAAPAPLGPRDPRDSPLPGPR